MTRDDMAEWIIAIVFVLTIFAIPYALGYLALAMGAN